MPETKRLTILWTAKAFANTTSIKFYLNQNFSEKEIARFYSLLSAFEEAVSIFPELYPKSKIHSTIRRAILSRELSAFYRIAKKQIEILAILDNRCDISKWI